LPDKNPIAEAERFANLRSNGISRVDICRQSELSECYVSQALGMLKLPEHVKALIADGTMPRPVGVMLTRFADKPEKLEAMLEAFRNGAPSGKLMDLREKLTEKKQPKPKVLTETGITAELLLKLIDNCGKLGKEDEKWCDNCPHHALCLKVYDKAIDAIRVKEGE
jgi:hypothetical protein